MLALDCAKSTLVVDDVKSPLLTIDDVNSALLTIDDVNSTLLTIDDVNSALLTIDDVNSAFPPDCLTSPPIDCVKSAEIPLTRVVASVEAR